MVTIDTHAEVSSRAASLFARDHACQLLDVRLVTVAPGRATLRMRVTDAMVNGHGIGHGGLVFLLADAAFACASNTHGPVAVAQSAHITFLRAAEVGDVLQAEAVERSHAGRVGLYDVSVQRADGAAIAEFRGQSVLLAGHRSLDATNTDRS